VSLQGSYLNVVGELTGSNTPENIYIIGCHYDHLEGDMPGGDDNASGTAGVLEAARILSQYQFESTIRFICFNAEEDDQIGSKDYVSNHVVPNGENIVGMINIEMILRPGSDVNPNTVIDAELEAQYKHPPSVALARVFQQAARDYVPALTVNDTIIDCRSTSDNDAFLENGFPAFLVLENSLPDFWEANSYWHKSEDASDRLANDPDSPSGVTYDFAFASNVTRAVVAFIAQEAKLVRNRRNASSAGDQ
jgi:Zn-dependent M28 family amino/carboxypeptidase